ncbi:MAG: bi-domain-containing oxidoreductase [Deltaproteobacteria bacterium]|nr:bi-domain-containing oxidoreductase [Deltaproteobacteria bacterium]
MRQVTQNLRTGLMRILEVPFPVLNPGEVTVRNHYSVISAGTEGNTVKTARASLVAKAKARPDDARQVIRSLRERGLTQTYRAVMKKLDAHSPLGYSCVGEVIEVGQGVGEFKVGDFVACGGRRASHAEVVCVPSNLCVKVNREGDLKQCAYNTLGAIAMQGVRQADLRLGESCAVIGLGVIGQLTCLLLRAAGVRVAGVDIDDFAVKLAAEHGADLALNRSRVAVEQQIVDFSGGYGCDAVIIAASSSSLDPVNFAGAISRKKGTIVVVGAVPTGFSREPHFYNKELTLKMSCSYGPGRYDPVYEEKGRDYPQAYVRWTEKRNMGAFQDLIARRIIDLGYLTTHTFRLEDAPSAYDMLLERSEPYAGILIEYDVSQDLKRGPVVVSVKRRHEGKVTIGFIGAGSYARGFLLPNIPVGPDVALKAVMTSTSTASRSVADRFGFEFCTDDVNDILKNLEINAVFIATRHDTHGRYVIESLKAGKHVFVEKPLCLIPEELDEIRMLCLHSSQPALVAGFNRRFAPLTSEITRLMRPGKMSMTYRVNAGAVSADSWIQDPETGGGRIIGEVCHFIDYLNFLTRSYPVRIHAEAMDDPHNNDDCVVISLKYANGSVGSIQYFANGSKDLAKEKVEIYSHGMTAVLADFRDLKVYLGGKPFHKRLYSQDMGRKMLVHSFIQAIKIGLPPPIPFEDIFSATDSSFKVLDSIRTAKAIQI